MPVSGSVFTVIDVKDEVWKFEFLFFFFLIYNLQIISTASSFQPSAFLTEATIRFPNLFLQEQALLSWDLSEVFKMLKSLLWTARAIHTSSPSFRLFRWTAKAALGRGMYMYNSDALQHCRGWQGAGPPSIPLGVQPKHRSPWGELSKTFSQDVHSCVYWSWSCESEAGPDLVKNYKRRTFNTQAAPSPGGSH